MKYLFVLGRDRELSALEVISFLRARNIKYEVVYSGGNFFVLDFDEFEISADEFGGVIKIGREILLENLVFDKNKISYSVYGTGILKKLKLILKQEKIKAMFKKYSDEPNNLDLEIVKVGKIIFEVFSVSNPKEYKKRDEIRPRFDEKKVISIRLAKILINLSQARNEILDPFCGCGTILQEGLLRNLNVVGVDRNISDARANLRWLKENFRFNGKFLLINGDAGKLNCYVKEAEAIVTEPYMGPYLRKLPQEEEAKNIAKELNMLYSKFFKEACNVVRGKIVFVEPIIKTFRKEVDTGLTNIINENGFGAVRFENAENPAAYKLKGSRIKRRIWVLERLK